MSKIPKRYSEKVKGHIKPSSGKFIESYSRENIHHVGEKLKHMQIRAIEAERELEELKEKMSDAKAVEYTDYEKQVFTEIAKQYGYKVEFVYNDPEEYEGRMHNSIAIFTKGDIQETIEKRTNTSDFSRAYNLFDSYADAESFDEAVEKMKGLSEEIFV